MMKLIILFFAITLGFTHFDSKEAIERSWYNEARTAKIQIYKTGDGKYYGKIVWLSEPNENGKPKVDRENPDATQRTTPLINLVILKNFNVNPKDSKIFESGTIYDPESGKTYCGKITLNGNTLKLKGFLCSLSWIGRSEVWTSAD